MMVSGYPGAEEHFTPFSNDFNSVDDLVIVIHKTGGDATVQNIYNTFVATRKSVHYGVGQDGVIWQFVPEDMGAGGNCCVEQGYDPFWWPYLQKYGNLNFCTLSIEHCDPASDNSTPLTPAQKGASFKLIKYLADKYGIDKDHIKGHASIDPVNKSRCPGNYPWTEMFDYVFAPGGSSDMSNVLKVVNNPTPGQVYQATTIWNKSTATPLNYQSGIAWLWKQCSYNGRNLGAPDTPEFPNVDWNNEAIVEQEFPGGHIEWKNGHGRVFARGVGELVFG